MRLYLVQHGKALPEEIDPQRPLSEEGREDVERVARFLKDAGIRVDTIWHSTKTRAIQTGQIFSEELASKEVIQRQGLAPNDPVDRLPDEIKRELKDLMIVGHLPFLQRLASLLLVGSESCGLVSFCQGGAVCLGRDEGSWYLLWAIVPELIKQRREYTEEGYV